MTKGYKIHKAATIGDVLRILERLRADGLDMSADWNGYDDGSLNIHPANGKWVSIEVDNGPDTW